MLFLVFWPLAGSNNADRTFLRKTRRKFPILFKKSYFETNSREVARREKKQITQKRPMEKNIEDFFSIAEKCKQNEDWKNNNMGSID